VRENLNGEVLGVHVVVDRSRQLDGGMGNERMG
jgi:hypothetical protein